MYLNTQISVIRLEIDGSVKFLVKNIKSTFGRGIWVSPY